MKVLDFRRHDGGPFAGTGAFAALGAQVTVSVATALGAEELRGVPAADGAASAERTRGRCVNSLPGFAAVRRRHASLRGRGQREHPRGVPCGRGAATGGCCAGPAPCRRTALLCPTRRPPRGVLAGTQGNILLATGAKELAAFAGLDAERLYPRVLPTHEGLAACEAAGVPHGNIIAHAGAFYAGAQRGADAPF